MKYKQPKPVSRDEASAILSGKSNEAKCRALVGLAFYDPDPAWLEELFLTHAQNENLDVAGVAITCLGHVARIHRSLNVTAVMPVLDELRRREPLVGRIEDAIEDFRLYLGSKTARED